MLFDMRGVRYQIVGLGLCILYAIQTHPRNCGAMERRGEGEIDRERGRIRERKRKRERSAEGK